MRIYHLIGLTGLVVVFVDMWTKKIWPEIRGIYILMYLPML